MRKKILITCFMSVIAALCFFPFASAFADMEKVDEAELARTNASVIGASVKDRINCVEKDGICSETKQDSVTSDKRDAVSFPVVGNTTESFSFSLNVDGKETFQFGMSGINSNRVGGTITSVQSR